ncbi:MAG TPA: SPFH domain-containing protein, partial [Edaphobacter sp.]
MQALTIVLLVVAVVLAIIVFLSPNSVAQFFGVVFVSKDRVGIVNKKWSLLSQNRTLPDGSIIALHGEAGVQADTLPPGVHFGLWYWQYSIKMVPFVTIERGQIGTVSARDGHAITPGRILAQNVESNLFQNARQFLENGGQRGQQIGIIPQGTYRINTDLFDVSQEEALDIPDNQIGIVTTKDGAPLRTGEIAGAEVLSHNSFQDGEAFIRDGGHKGLQEQVLKSGRYFINPRFATVEIKPMTEVPIASVGVVISFVGEEGEDQTGEHFKHGNLVKKGQKGVWVDPLDPGMYAINPYTHKVEMVPTANIVLNWATGKSEAHKLDSNLSTITVRSSDGFRFNLDVSQIIHIPRNDAPKVISRFGTMRNLVTQVLEPTIGNYFRNAAQKSDVIQFLNQRIERQNEAKASIQAALNEYNVNAIDTLIGDIVPPDDLMKTLTDRKIAEQEKITYQTQEEAEVTRKGLEQAKAVADTQARVVDAERSVSIAEFAAQAAIKKAEGEARAKTLNAESDAGVITRIGTAEAEKTKAIGTAEAEVIKSKIASMDSQSYVAIQIAQVLASNNINLVPQIQAGSGGGSLIEAFLSQMMLQKQP